MANILSKSNNYQIAVKQVCEVIVPLYSVPRTCHTDLLSF